jgi:hypothetical protein
MIYYILPKNNARLQITPQFKPDHDNPECIISHSVNYYNAMIQTQIDKLLSLNKELTTNKFQQANLFVNPYEFLFSKVPTYKLSVSKLPHTTADQYELIELAHVCNILDAFKYNQALSVCHVDCISSSADLLSCIRDNSHVTHHHEYEPNIQDLVYKLLPTTELISNTNNANNKKFDLIFFNFDFNINSNNNLQTNICKTFHYMIYALFIILRAQAYNGTCVIKVDHLHYRLIIDIIYILNATFNKVHIIKPSCAPIISSARYIVCKHYVPSAICNSQIEALLHLMVNKNMYNVDSLLDSPVPCHFMTKIEEVNVIVGQQQLDGYFQIINILKNKHKEEKFETMRRNNVQKCVQWCEKHKILYNKFLEKSNMFSQKNPKNMFTSKPPSDDELNESNDV